MDVQYCVRNGAHLRAGHNSFHPLTLPLIEPFPKGYLIMNEPTEEMILAGAKAAADQIYEKGGVWDRGYIEEDQKQLWLNAAKFAWKAMHAVNCPAT